MRGKARQCNVRQRKAIQGKALDCLGPIPYSGGERPCTLGPYHTRGGVALVLGGRNHVWAYGVYTWAHTWAIYVPYMGQSEYMNHFYMRHVFEPYVYTLSYVR